MPFSLVCDTDPVSCGAIQRVQLQPSVFVNNKLVVVVGDLTEPHSIPKFSAIIKNGKNTSTVFVNNIPIVVEKDGLPGHGPSPHTENASLYTDNGSKVKAY
jgi:hypothetical protein